MGRKRAPRGGTGIAGVDVRCCGAVEERRPNLHKSSAFRVRSVDADDPRFTVAVADTDDDDVDGDVKSSDLIRSARARRHDCSMNMDATNRVSGAGTVKEEGVQRDGQMPSYA